MANQWILEDLPLERLRDLIVSYHERDEEVGVVALLRILDVVKAQAEENKDCVRAVRLSHEEHPFPDLVVEEDEEEIMAVINHLFDYLNVIESDFKLMKDFFAQVDPAYASRGMLNVRILVKGFRTKMLKTFGELVDLEARAQKVQDVRRLIYTSRKRTLNRRIVDVVLGLSKDAFENLNPGECMEKLKRVCKCLGDVLAVGREFILRHGLVPQPESGSFPVVAQPSESQQGSPPSLMMQHLNEADDLIDKLYECTGVIDDCVTQKLKMKQLEQVEEVVTKMTSAMEKSAVAEGAVYLEALEEQ